MKFSDRVKMFLLMRFIPQRTLLGLGLTGASAVGLINQILGSPLCTGESPSAVCALLTKALAVIGPWLVYIGVTDRKRAA